METLLGTLLAFIIVFGVIVFAHEFGHFIMGRLMGIRVEVFSFGYGKRLFGFKKGHTDYRVSLIPMGGYVKFLGEGMFNPGRELAPDDFMAKKRWQRFLVIVMGAVMNILLAVGLVALLNMRGVFVAEYWNEKPVIGWIAPDSPAQKAGLRVDDEILSIGRDKVRTWTDVEIAVGTRPEKTVKVEVLRSGQRLALELLTEMEKRARFEMGYAGFYGKIPTQVMMVSPNSPAEKAGLQVGDVIREIDGRPVYLYQFVETINGSPDKELEVVVERDGESVTLHVTPRREGKAGKVGIYHGPKSAIKKYGFFAAIGQSVRENIRLTFLVINFLKNIFTGEVSARQIGGPIEIANFSYAALRMGFAALVGWIALFSLQLGIINLVPIPVLDGGQLFVLIIEGVCRRDLSPKARQVWMQVGFVIFVFLIVFVILNDIVKRLPNGWGSLIPF